MIDLILWAANKPALATFGKNHPPAQPLLQDDGAGGASPRLGVDYTWWKDSGKFMTNAGTYDAEGNELTAPTFLPGVVLLLRINDAFFSDTIHPGDDGYDEATQEGRSRVIAYIKTNGVYHANGGFPYHELDGVRIFNPSDVEAFLTSNNLPGHIWVGGNSY